MTGLISLQQGPFGVAASTRRPVTKPSLQGIAQPAEPDSATLDRPTRNDPPRAHRGAKDKQQNQGAIESVAPATLFEASRIATSLALPEPTPAPSFPTRMQPWTPPGSTLALRDRSV